MPTSRPMLAFGRLCIRREYKKGTVRYRASIDASKRRSVLDCLRTETRDAKRETRDARRETRDARRETRDARRETRDARRETRDAKRETRDGSGACNADVPSVAGEEKMVPR